MPDKDEHIRGIALEHLPLDTDGALALIEHSRNNAWAEATRVKVPPNKPRLALG